MDLCRRFIQIVDMKPQIIPLPFLNNPPSNYNTIFTVLEKTAENNRQKHMQSIVASTFDQPLYLKGREIVACHEDQDPNLLEGVLVRLGGFHMLLSYLAAVGFIFDGTGILEAFYTIFAQNSADKAFAGHAYSRSVRAHLLVQQALLNIILSSIDLSDIEKAQLHGILQSLGEEDFMKNIENDCFVAMKKKFMEKIEI